MNASVPMALVTAVAAGVTWWARARHDKRLEAIAKPLTTLALLGTALTLDVASAGALALFATALVAYTAADVLLLPTVERRSAGLSARLLGMLSFGLGALALGFESPRLAGLAAVGFGLGMAVIGGPILVGVTRRSPRRRRPVTAYVATIGVMVALLWGSARPLAMVGGALLAVSEALLGWNRFVRQLRHAPLVVLVTYHLGLAALVAVLQA